MPEEAGVRACAPVSPVRQFGVPRSGTPARGVAEDRGSPAEFASARPSHHLPGFARWPELRGFFGVWGWVRGGSVHEVKAARKHGVRTGVTLQARRRPAA